MDDRETAEIVGLVASVLIEEECFAQFHGHARVIDSTRARSIGLARIIVDKLAGRLSLRSHDEGEALEKAWDEGPVAGRAHAKYTDHLSRDVEIRYGRAARPLSIEHARRLRDSLDEVLRDLERRPLP